MTTITTNKFKSVGERVIDLNIRLHNLNLHKKTFDVLFLYLKSKSATAPKLVEEILSELEAFAESQPTKVAAKTIEELTKKIDTLQAEMYAILTKEDFTENRVQYESELTELANKAAPLKKQRREIALSKGLTIL